MTRILALFRVHYFLLAQAPDRFKAGAKKGGLTENDSLNVKQILLLNSTSSVEALTKRKKETI